MATGLEACFYKELYNTESRMGQNQTSGFRYGWNANTQPPAGRDLVVGACPSRQTPEEKIWRPISSLNSLTREFIHQVSEACRTENLVGICFSLNIEI